MNVIPLVELSPYWIESSDIETRAQSGTYIIEGQAVAGYHKPLSEAVMAQCFMWDDLCEKEVMTIQAGRRAPFGDIDRAKAALEMIARPGIKTKIIV